MFDVKLKFVLLLTKFFNQIMEIFYMSSTASSTYYEALRAYETAQQVKGVLPDTYREGLEKTKRVAKQVLDQYPH